jgi:hypothetical protein
MAPNPPASRDDFRIAIVYALQVEFDAVSRLLDHCWDADRDRYGRARGDINAYTTGRIGENDVVLLSLTDAGKASSASATAGLRSSFPQLELTLLVGICGDVPRPSIDHRKCLYVPFVETETLVRTKVRLSDDQRRGMLRTRTRVRLKQASFQGTPRMPVQSVR